MKKHFSKLIAVLCAAMCCICFAGCDFLFHKHSYTESTVEPTCESKGYTLFSCKCGDSYRENEVPALGHKLVYSSAVEATCTHVGLSAGTHCWVCHKSIDAQEIIPKLPHLDEEHDGVCDVCNTHFEDIIDIGNANELKSIGNNLNGAYRLVSDISLTNMDWLALGSASQPFTGKLYGMEHTISGLALNNTSLGGLFAYNAGTIEGVVLKNVSLSLENMTGTMGSLSAYNVGSIVHCKIEGNVTIKNSVSRYEKKSWPNYNGTTVNYTGTFGGICAVNEGTVSDCTLDATFNCVFSNSNEYDLSVLFPYFECGHSSTSNSTLYFGGVCGRNSGTIDLCSMFGSNSNTIDLLAQYNGHGTSTARINAYIGSLVGTNDSTIANSTGTKSKFVKNIGTTDLKESSGSTYGIVCELNLSEDPIFAGIIGQNNGEATNVLYS